MRFFDKRIYVKFTSSVTLTNPATGAVDYYTNIASDTQVNTSVTMGEVRGGVGNPIVAIIPSDTNVTVDFTTPDFNLKMRAMQAGGKHGFGAPTRKCVDVKPSSTTLTVPVETSGTPVAGLGYSDIFCYVQTVGDDSTILGDGVPYALNPTTGVVSGFTADTTKTYKVWYWVNKATTEYATLTANFDPTVEHCEIVQPVYANEQSAADRNGTKIGELITIIPYLKLGGAAGVTGSQSDVAKTNGTGTAIAYEDAVVKAGCGDCNETSSDLVHYLFVRCDDTGMLDGLYLLGGSVEMETNSTYKTSFRLQVNGSSSAVPDPAYMNYEMGTNSSSITVDSNGVITSGSSAGEATLTATYNDGTTTLTCTAPVTVTSE